MQAGFGARPACLGTPRRLLVQQSPLVHPRRQSSQRTPPCGQLGPPRGGQGGSFKASMAQVPWPTSSGLEGRRRQWSPSSWELGGLVGWKRLSSLKQTLWEKMEPQLTRRCGQALLTPPLQPGWCLCCLRCTKLFPTPGPLPGLFQLKHSCTSSFPSRLQCPSWGGPCLTSTQERSLLSFSLLGVVELHVCGIAHFRGA